MHFEEIVTGSTSGLTYVDVKVDDLYNKVKKICPLSIVTNGGNQWIDFIWHCAGSRTWHLWSETILQQHPVFKGQFCIGWRTESHQASPCLNIRSLLTIDPAVTCAIFLPRCYFNHWCCLMLYTYTPRPARRRASCIIITLHTPLTSQIYNLDTFIFLILYYVQKLSSFLLASECYISLFLNLNELVIYWVWKVK